MKFIKLHGTQSFIDVHRIQHFEIITGGRIRDSTESKFSLRISMEGITVTAGFDSRDEAFDEMNVMIEAATGVVLQKYLNEEEMKDAKVDSIYRDKPDPDDYRLQLAESGGAGKESDGDS